ncbi:YbhB/YbcL family Raf kinase inhibitor-like protein [Herbaspirillum sp. LeCh32-8]|uniref:YbhB/YbcL family Raf kinase inhibitor-like protein n=1 Tax=Herbaspirillum sp. LeCh32-8 TaxID=2821356 RepID=UPI001AE9B748|nr:YbhB/YbcL family Raf kinase inhibitor-like protein [Herbaspirillum sp. LeCh32-8]MBP0598445.1 YbhB/YbcL family Raf kinase inhibitor-like protein [Herbaspirillum sp. LeCh32-8]
MKFWSDSFKDGDTIPGEFAFAVADPKTHVALSSNRNPHFAWSELPAGTKSLALVVHDPDVPSRGDDVNQEGKTVPLELPRVDFYHWALVDIPPSVSQIKAGQFSNGVTARGKPGPAVLGDTMPGARQGINDYTGWFAGDGDMRGDYFGYDGPCPPWNDALVHRYIFTLYALDVEQLPVVGNLEGSVVVTALRDHVLEHAAITGLYTLNPKATR